MKAYVYEDVPEVTDAYHGEGGLLIVTDGDPLAAWIVYSERHPARAWLPEPSAVYDVAGGEERVFVFPDAGCC